MSKDDIAPFPALSPNHAPAGSQIDNVEVHLRTERSFCALLVFAAQQWPRAYVHRGEMGALALVAGGSLCIMWNGTGSVGIV